VKLEKGEVQGVIAPLEVGNWISRQIGLSVRVLPEKDAGSPVAFAVAKGNTALADRISVALATLKKKGLIDAIMNEYLHWNSGAGL
jgi:polar amino acid transport system substrate-binding protein